MKPRFKVWSSSDDFNIYANLLEILDILQLRKDLNYYLEESPFGIGRTYDKDNNETYVIQQDGIAYFMLHYGHMLFES